jgi:hypothetical protein
MEYDQFNDRKGFKPKLLYEATKQPTEVFLDFLGIIRPYEYHRDFIA